jgi:hypothetical protein
MEFAELQQPKYNKFKIEIMKQITILLILLFSSVSLLSQSIVSSSKTWSNLLFHYPGFTFTTEYIRVTDDTVIGSVQYKRVEISTDPVQSVWSFYGYARETADKKVFYRQNAQQSEKLLYDLNASNGDSLMVWSLLDYQTNRFDSVMYHVTSTDSVMIGGNYRKQLHLSISRGSSFLEVGQWVDSLGCLSAGMLHNSTGLVGGDSFTLLCFLENSEVKYHLQGYSSCYIVTSTGENISLASRLKICPNPLTTKSIIEVPFDLQNHSLSLDVFKVSSERVYHMDFKGSAVLNHDSFKQGSYVITIRDQGELLFRGKLIVI